MKGHLSLLSLVQFGVLRYAICMAVTRERMHLAVTDASIIPAREGSNGLGFILFRCALRQRAIS